MAVGFKVEFFWYQIGTGDFLHSFFSTIAYNLENKNWGSRFPVIMNELYQGKMSAENVDKAITELEIIKKELKKYPPQKAIWDIDDLSKQSPWIEWQKPRLCLVLDLIVCLTLTPVYLMRYLFPAKTKCILRKGA